MPSANALLQSRPFVTLDALTAEGVTENGLSYGAQAITYQVTVADIGTSVVIRFEGSLDGVNYFNLEQNNADYTITANGTTGYCLSGCPVNYARLRLVTITGGSPSVATLIGAG
jgi:hypothetical protein